MFIFIEKRCSKDELNYREREEFQSLFRDNEETAKTLKELGLKSRAKGDLFQFGMIKTIIKGVTVHISSLGIKSRFCKDIYTGNNIAIFSNGIILQENSKGKYNIAKRQDIPYLLKIDVLGNEEKSGNDLLEIDLIGNIEKNIYISDIYSKIELKEFDIKLSIATTEIKLQEKLKI